MPTDTTVKPNMLAAACQAEMPRYRCHKQVWALKIKQILLPGSGATGHYQIVPEESGYAPFPVEHAFILKHDPQVGGYYVVYADGYKSYSPAKAFEEGYTKIS